MSSGTERWLKQRLLAGGRVLNAVAQLGLMAFAACQGDVGKQMQHFAGRRRRGAGGLQSVAPLRGWSNGWGGHVSVEPSRVSKGHREGIGERAFAVDVRCKRLRRGHRRHRARARVREGSAGGGWGGLDGGWAGERRGTVWAEGGPQVG